MKKISLIALLLISLVVLSAKSSVAQDSTFKLSDYKNPNYFYQTLDLNFRLNSRSAGSKSDNTSHFHDGNRYDFSLNARAAYSLYSNSLKSQSQLDVWLPIFISKGGLHNIYELQNKEDKQNSFSHNEAFQIYGLKRFYNTQQNYFEVNGSISTGYSGNSGTSKNYDSDTIFNSISANHKGANYSMNGSFLIGNGRIEQVQDAQLALYLLEDMQRLNLDKRSVSNKEVLELARLITSLKYKRFFDDRLKKIAEITAIDSFMQKTGLVSISDAAYFTSLNDNWDYANNPARESGYRLFTGIQGSFASSSNRNHEETFVPVVTTTDRKSSRHESYLYLVAGLTHEKPINLKWQQSASVKASAGFKSMFTSYGGTNVSDIKEYTSAIPALRINADYGYGFYPNSRTWLNANIYIAAIYEEQYAGTSKEDKELWQNSFSANTGLNVHAYYYLSEKLRLSVSFSGYYDIYHDKFFNDLHNGTNDEETRSDWNHQMQATLTYSLF